jgi:hypothetical protein
MNVKWNFLPIRHSKAEGGCPNREDGSGGTLYNDRFFVDLHSGHYGLFHG